MHRRLSPRWRHRNWWLDSWIVFHWRTFTRPHQLEVRPWWRQA